ncbi:MAG TPA: sigma-54 dependent transcriptional regulator [Prolixibacteraceae bacterium]|nr:sigma-54 dependent transcriptional regulator [Prolixibacteraceae bacterium]
MALNNKPYKIFVVDDESLFRKILCKTLQANKQYEVFPISSGTECLKRLDENPDIISLDYRLPDIDGRKVLMDIMKRKSPPQVIIVSGQNDIDTAIDLLKIGAYDYIVKGADTREKLSITIEKIVNQIELKKENENLREAVADRYCFKKLIKGSSKAIEHVFEMMDKAVRTNINVSVYGETGTGKELVAKGVHYNSGRSHMPFVPVNVSSIPETLVESELFGYEKGAFTGADAAKAGKIEMAHGGTLFLDEIAEMNLNVQAKLLRVLQEREVTRIGSHKPFKFDVRLVIATHRNLKEEVEKGHFRDDLYYRLLGLTIDLPPLRQRGNDVIILAQYFIDVFCDENKMERKHLSGDAIKKLRDYTFPGNVRELRALMELACVLTDDGIINESHINISPVNFSKNLLGKEKTLQEYNEDIIRYFVDKYDNVREAARRLNVGKSTIYRYLKQA